MIIIIFLLFLIFLIKPKNYTKEYNINKVSIIENFNKKDKSYYFNFKYKDITLDLLFNSSYKQHRTFIKDIKIIEDGDNFCLIPKGDTFKFYPLCYDNNKVTHFNNINDNLKEKLGSKYYPKDKKITTYKDIEIYSTDYNYYIWNYNGFYYLNSNKSKKIELFDKEKYNVNLIGSTTNYLVIPDYEKDYDFNTFYTIEFKTGKVKKYNLKNNIYFDSNILGYEKDKLYFIDTKENTMYEFNAKNGKLDKIKPKILSDGKWEKTTLKSLINKKKTFTYNTNYEYKLDDNNLYLNYKDKKIKTLITTDIKEIVKISDSNIFYIKEDSLYSFNPVIGERLLLKYFEWNFNYANIIYLN